MGSVKGDKLGAVGSPEGPGCPQSPVCTGTSEEGLPNKSLNCRFLKARRLRQLAHLILPLPMVSSVAHNGQVQLEPASMDHPQDQPPGAEGRLEMDGVGVITSKEAYTQSKSPFKPSYKSHGTWLQRIFKNASEFSSSQLTKTLLDAESKGTGRSNRGTDDESTLP